MELSTDDAPFYKETLDKLLGGEGWESPSVIF